MCRLAARFYSLWDTGYAKIHIPIIASVSEHQPTTWFSFFFDLHILVLTYPVGLWYCIKNINDERVFSESADRGLVTVVSGMCNPLHGDANTDADYDIGGRLFPGR